MAANVTSLTWGVKQSFRNYVESAGGVIEVGGGAERAADGGFTFTAAPGEGLSLDADGKPVGRGLFLGEARFDAHGGMLKVCLADPVVEISASGAVITAFDSSARTHRFEIARLDLAAMSAGEDGELVIPTALSMDGIQVLGDHYPLNTALDPVRLGGVGG